MAKSGRYDGRCVKYTNMSLWHATKTGFDDQQRAAQAQPLWSAFIEKSIAYRVVKACIEPALGKAPGVRFSLWCIGNAIVVCQNATRQPDFWHASTGNPFSLIEFDQDHYEQHLP